MKHIFDRNLYAVLLGALLPVLALSGCSSTPTSKQIAKEEAAAAQVRAEAAKDRQEVATKEADRHLSTVPGWVIEPPRPDGQGIYGVGVADSAKVETAITKAKLKAEFDLAKQYKQFISGSERSYQDDVGRGVPAEKYTQLIDKVVDQVPVVGYEVVKSQVEPGPDTFYAYFLLKMPYDAYNRVLEGQRAAATDAETKEAFADLERRLEKRHKQIEAQNSAAKVSVVVDQDPPVVTPSISPAAVE